MHVVVHLDLSAFLPIAISILSILIATYALIYRKNRDKNTDEKELQDKQEKIETKIFELINLYIRIQHDRLEFAYNLISSRLAYQYYKELYDTYSPNMELTKRQIIIEKLNHEWANNNRIEQEHTRQLVALKIKSKLDAAMFLSSSWYHKWDDIIKEENNNIHHKMDDILLEVDFNELLIYNSLREHGKIPSLDYKDYNFETYKQLTSKIVPLLIKSRIDYNEYAKLIKKNKVIYDHS